MEEKLRLLWCAALEVLPEEWELLKESEDVEIDSLMIVKFIVDVEEEFGVELDDEMLLSSGDDIYEKVLEILKEQERVQNR